MNNLSRLVILLKGTEKYEQVIEEASQEYILSIKDVLESLSKE
jgi:hypothetical protein